MNKPIFLGMSILDISKILVHELWCDYGDKAKICYTDTDTFVIYIATEDFFEDTADNVKIRFDTSNIDENDKRPLGIGKNTKTTGLFKLKSGGKIIIEVVALIAKSWSYLMDDGSEHKKTKGIKKAVIKKKNRFENYKKCSFDDENMRKLQQALKSELHNLHTIKVNKTALSSNDNKRLQTFNRITTFPNKTSIFKLCKNEMLNVRKAKETLLRKECENEMYVTCNIFLKYMETKCVSKMKKYVNFKAKKHIQKI